MLRWRFSYLLGCEMKKILILFALYCFFSSCSENLSPDIDSEENLIISSNIENISDYSNYNRIYCYFNKLGDSISIVDESNILPSGYFHLIIPPPPVSQLRMYSPYNYNSGGTVFIDSINFSKDSVLFTDIRIKVSNPNNIHYFVNNLHLESSLNLSVGDFAISYYYFSETCKISGHYTRIYPNVNVIVTKYDLEVKKGWNKIVTTLIKTDSSFDEYVEWKVSNQYENKDGWEIKDFPDYGQRLL